MKKHIKKIAWGVLLVAIALTAGWYHAQTNVANASLRASIPTTNYPHWVKVHKEYAAFSGGSAFKTIVIYAPAANGIITNVRADVTEEFTGGTAIASTLSVGQTTNTDFIAATSVFTVPSTTLGLPGTTPVLTALSSAPSLTATIVLTGDSTNDLTKGKVDIYYLVQTLP